MLDDVKAYLIPKREECQVRTADYSAKTISKFTRADGSFVTHCVESSLLTSRSRLENSRGT
jgi:hypothetical protein